MKKLFYAVFLFTSLGFSQSKEFTFNKDGITDYLVVEVPGKTAAELYQQTINWIKMSYKNPDSVIKATIENDYVRFMGSSTRLLCFNNLGKNCYDSNYQIEVSFQDGKYKFDLIEVNLLGTKSDPHMTLTDMSEYYKSNGQIKGTYKYFPEIFPSFFNDINKSLLNYVSGETQQRKKDW